MDPESLLHANPTSVYHDIATRYGVDVTSRESLNHPLPPLPAETQGAIAQELRKRDGEAPR
ncbi:MAG: hypothetical protein GDA68_00875 [Nitrospira sp. CR2.1]|nr:hypothetical protein [Nitrospira sp. CR2.1]